MLSGLLPIPFHFFFCKSNFISDKFYTNEFSAQNRYDLLLRESWCTSGIHKSPMNDAKTSHLIVKFSFLFVCGGGSSSPPVHGGT